VGFQVRTQTCRTCRVPYEVVVRATLCRPSDYTHGLCYTCLRKSMAAQKYLTYLVDLLRNQWIAARGPSVPYPPGLG
jgi:hypothetical protein